MTRGPTLLHSPLMTHPLASRLAPLMGSDLGALRAIVAEWVVETPCEKQRAILRAFGSELGAVQRRIRNRPVPPTCEEIEIALTAVLALASRRSQQIAPPGIDPAVFSFAQLDDEGQKEPLSS